MRDFRKLSIWEKAIDLVLTIYRITSTFPETEKFGLVSQLRRASVSIPSNIAEGCSRVSQIEFKRFLEMALGSLFEVDSHLIISIKLDYIKEEQIQKTLSEIEGLQKQISKFISILKLENQNKANS